MIANNTAQRVNKVEEKFRPFGLKDKVAYLLGDFGNDFSFLFVSSFLLVFCTKVLGISGAVVGTIFMLSKFVDAFTDVGMGRIVDTAKPTKAGRFRPWILRMSFPLAISNALMWMYFVKDWSMMAKVIYIGVTYILWGSFCYTGMNIPYGSMVTSISPEPKDRASLSTWRTIGAMLAGLAINMITPIFIYSTDASGNQIVLGERFTVVGIIFSVLGLVCHLLCYKMSVERVKIDPQSQKQQANKKHGFMNLMKSLVTNKALVSLILSTTLVLIATTVTTALRSYLFIDYFRNAKSMIFATLINTVAMASTGVVASKLAQKFGKKEVGCAGLLLSALVLIALYLMRVDKITTYYALMFVNGIGFGIYSMYSWAYLTDVCDYQEIKNGKRDDGTVYAIYSFFRKMGQAMATGLGGFVLTIIGYQSVATSQTEIVINRIYDANILLPGVIYIAVFLIMVFTFPLNKKQVDENTKILKERHANA